MENNFEQQFPFEPEPREREQVKEAFATVNKRVREGSGAAAGIAAINILVGAVALFAFDVMPDGLVLDSLAGIFYILYGLIFITMAVGIYRRSRVCAVIATLVYAADSVYFFVERGLTDLNFSVLMRGGFLLSFGYGLWYCFKFHKLAKEHEASMDSELYELVHAKPKMKTARRVVYALIAVGGIIAAILGFVIGGDAGGDFADWTSLQAGSITVQIPSTRVTEDVDTDPMVPGIYFINLQSISRAAEVVVVHTEGLSDHAFLAPMLGELAHYMLHGGGEALTDQLEESAGTMQGVPYESVRGSYRGRRPFELRALIIEGEVYIVGIVISREDHAELIEQFFDSVVIDMGTRA